MAENDRIEDPETGISLRFIRQWKPKPADFTPFDLALISCRSLGHIFEPTDTSNEQRCTICGIYKTTVSG